METRYLGRSGLELPVFGFGCMTFSDGVGYFGKTGSTNGASANRQIEICLEHGVNFFDTADTYAGGRSEEILGEALTGKRHKVTLATKGFFRMGKGLHDVGLSRRHLVDACSASLRRLKTDWIDLYIVHNFDARVPLEETLRALSDLVQDGKIRYLACSNHAAWQLAKAIGISQCERLNGYVGQQIQYSLMARESEEELLPCAMDQGVGTMVWSPLAQGFLSGKFRGNAASVGRLALTGELAAYDNPRGHAVLAAIDSVVQERNQAVTPTQVALNWLRARRGVTSILIGARTEEQLLDNLGAAQWSLTETEIETLDRASEVPLRYPVAIQYSFAGERNTSPFKRYA